MQPNRSMWMNRWMATSSNSTQVHNQLSRHDENRGKTLDLEQGDRVINIAELSKHKRLDMNAPPCDFSEYRKSSRCQGEDVVIASNVPQSTKAVEVVTESKRVEITYGTLITNSRNIRTSRLELQPISVFNFSEKMGSILAQKHMAVSIENESNFQSDDVSKHDTNMGPSNSHIFFKALRSAPSEAAFPLKEYPSRPESNVQCQSRLRKPYILLDKDKMHNVESGNRMNDLTSARLLPTQSSPVQLRRLEELNNGCHSSSEVPHPDHHSDELRKFSSVGAVEAVSRGPRFSQTNNHRLPITNVSKGNQISRASPISSKFKESASRQFTLLPGFDCHDESSVKLHPLESPRNSEGKKDEWNASLASKNESSAETDTMDINVCQTWNSLPSITSSPSYKASLVGKSPSMSHSTLPRDKLGSRKRNIELPDINQEPPSSLAAERENENMDLSTSTTESLDLEHLLHIDQVGNPSTSQQYPTVSPDPSSRWVKRLKPSSSDHHAHGTKNVKIGDSSFTEKVDNLYNQVTDYNRSSSKPTSNGYFGEAREIEVHKTSLSLGNKEPATVDAMEKRWEVNLSHPWIRRWCHNQGSRPQMNSVAPLACELDSPKMALDEDQTKQFPSIGAMALMGKAMNGLQSCEFQNKGSFVVWSSGGYS